MGANINPIAASPSRPTLEAIEHRRKELLALHQQTHSKTQPQSPELHPFPTDPQPTEPPPFEAQRDDASWPTPASPALYGLAGQAVRALAPHTEADPAAILLQFLGAFGSIAGPNPHCTVESTRHGLNLFIVLVGESSKARKGTSWRHICRLFSEVDAPWVTDRIINARLTADGLIHAVRDEESPTDRRLLILAEELAYILHLLGRQKGHLAPTLLSAWDHGHLRTLDRHHPLQATGAHISLIGHITRQELAPLIARNAFHNGFANRCLWATVRRSQCLPNGGNLNSDQLSAIAGELRRALAWANTTEHPIRRSPVAQQLWDDRYPHLSQGRLGLQGGAATSRGEAQVLRLSAIYATLDATPVIEEQHLQAALAVWDYCSASAALLFIVSQQEETAALIRQAIDSSQGGLCRNDIRKLFHGHVASRSIDAALEQLASLGVITRYTEPTGGRPRTTWEANTGQSEETLQD